MTIYNLISTLSKPLETIQRIGFKLSDLQYIELYEDYLHLLEKKFKKTYIVAHLSEQYGISERKVYQLLRAYQTPMQPKCSGVDTRRIVHLTPPC